MFDKQVGHVQVLTKAFTILNIIGESREPLTLTQIGQPFRHVQDNGSPPAEKSGRPSVRIHRPPFRNMCSALRSPASGPRPCIRAVASTGYSIARALYDATKRSLCICTLSGFEIVYLQKIAPRITIKQDVGSMRPAYCTALGKCQLAYLPEEELDRLIETHGLPPMTPNTVCDVAQFKESLKEARRPRVRSGRQPARGQPAGGRRGRPHLRFFRQVHRRHQHHTIALHDRDILNTRNRSPRPPPSFPAAWVTTRQTSNGQDEARGAAPLAFFSRKAPHRP